MGLVVSMLKREEAEASPFLSSAKRPIQMPGIQNASHAMEKQGICHSGI
jgi:hypothetical protein